MVENARGIIMFSPAPHAFGTPYAQFQYRFVDPEDASKSSADANVSVFLLGLSVYYRRSIAVTPDEIEEAGTSESHVLL
eukprot:2598195-Prymnesium_polylepis.1